MREQKLNKYKYKDIYEYTENICTEIKIKQEIRITIFNSKYMSGSAKGTKNLSLSTALLELYGKNNKVIQLVISHELAHIKNKDTSFKSCIKRITWDIMGTKKSISKSLLQELRADIEGSTYSHLNNDEIDSSHMIIKFHNERLRAYKDYEYGYTTREKRSYYSQKYTVLNENAIEEIINDYCLVKKIKEPKNLIKWLLTNSKML